MEVLAFYIAAAIHDYDHPGVNNHFLIATSDPRALLYNDKSVLENHHCASAFKVMRRKGCDFAGGLARKEYRGLREGIVEMVLATDLAQHFSLLAMFKKKVLTSEGFDPISTREDRTLLMQMLMKCSDVSNPTKTWPIYRTWIQRITEEFFSQGDKEKELGLPISPFCNREGAKSGDPSSSQKSFIEFIVAPLVEAVGEWVELGVIREGLEGSRERFGGGAQNNNSNSSPHGKNLNTITPLPPGSSGVFLRRNRSVPGGLEAIGAPSAPLIDHVPPLPIIAPEGGGSGNGKRRESWAGSLVGVGETLVARMSGSRRGSAATADSVDGA
ncbi:cAMP-specific 3',5'-cyclic phosphodiesterase 4D [Thoreauomyces humboldtii]|nr:cAMP-specific 3',5'-cyclic phosphodiesterase 4D [Thoreauomyces humboldtii]